MRCAVAPERDRDGVAGFPGVDRGLQVADRGDPSAADGGDHVAATESCPCSRCPAAYRAYRGAAGRGGLCGDAEVGVLGLAGPEQLCDDGADGIRRDGEADAVVSARIALDL